MEQNKREEIQEKAAYCLQCKIKQCQMGCPLSNDIPSFIQCMKQENYEEAYRVLTQTTVLSSICGRICPHESQCQGKCVRGIKGAPVSIGELEAFVGDMALKNGYEIGQLDKKEENKNKKIAVVGSGPAGLTCAAFLARRGFSVTIYEKYEQLGGILAHGIPAFRLSREVLKKTIDQIISLGIEVQTGKELGKNLLIETLENNYDAIFLAMGANIPMKMEIEGEELQGVYGGNSLLEKEKHPDYIGKSVAIIGGGNVAMDCARTIKKLGAEEVFVIYRRAEKQMPAERKEIEDAKQEGITFLFQNNIVKIMGEDKVEQIECIKTELVKKEGETREVPIDIEGSNYRMNMDYVVMAVGSKTEQDMIQTLGITTSNRGHIVMNEKNQTSKEKVFVGGDVAGAKATVAWAARSGRDAAEHIAEFLN